MLLLLANSSWILGLALLLASFSYHYAQATVRERPLVRQLEESGFWGAAWVSLVLIGLGAAGTSRQVWEAVLWLLLSLAGAWQAVGWWIEQIRGTEEI